MHNYRPGKEDENDEKPPRSRLLAVGLVELILEPDYSIPHYSIEPTWGFYSKNRVSLSNLYISPRMTKKYPPWEVGGYG